MCELFAYSSLNAISARISLEELARHGGGSGRHRDGWGAAFYQGHDALLIREPHSAGQSACMQFLLDHPVQSTFAIAHVRKAVQGARTLANTQPFARELAGRLHVFAHNGVLPGIASLSRGAVRRFEPIGETDSELAFCMLLEHLEGLWRTSSGVPSLAARRKAIAEFAQTLRGLGPANFIYCDSDAMFAHADRRTQADGAIRPPGLHWCCPSVSPQATPYFRA